MKRYKQYDHVLIDDFEMEEWPHPRHTHNHYEIVCIGKGSGTHFLNGVTSPYKSEDLFLLGPDDEHEFSVQAKTHFMYFKFTMPYIKGHPGMALPEDWNKMIDQLLYYPERKKGNILTDPDDRNLAVRIMKAIMTEYKSDRPMSQLMVYQLFSSLVVLMKRNTAAYEQRELYDPSNSDLAEEFLKYVEHHIYDPEQLTLKALAAHFHYSPGYVGVLFKEKVGESLSRYTSDFRFNLIEKRLKYSRRSMKQIADEFGFVDESHLNRFVKSKTGKTPSLVRAE